MLAVFITLQKNYFNNAFKSISLNLNKQQKVKMLKNKSLSKL